MDTGARRQYGNDGESAAARISGKWAAEYVAPVVLYMASELSGDKTNRTLFASGSRVMELKLTADNQALLRFLSTPSGAVIKPFRFERVR